MRKNFGPKPWLYTMPVLIIGTYDDNGIANAMNAAWGMISDVDKITICLDAKHKTAENIFKKNEDGTKGDQVSKADQIDMLASNQASDAMEQTALDWANKFQNIDSSANDKEKKWLDSMLNDKGLGSFSEDQIRALQNGEKLQKLIFIQRRMNMMTNF